jgi:cyanophycinase
MAAGLGLFPGVIVDQHFAERGRVGRLVAAVAQNPRILGVGIDEDTAIICEPDGCFSVLGRGAVYVLDGSTVSYSNLTEEDSDRALSTFGVRLHMLTMGDEFDLATRTPHNRPAEEVERRIVEEARKAAARPKKAAKAPRAPRRKSAAARG